MKTDKQITVLMYHRIDTVDTDPWGICVAPHLFEEQIQYLTSHYPVLPVAEAIQQATTNSIQKHSICITFDDGYADNYTHAKPVLEQYNCPASFFIPTAFIGSVNAFWWDELEYIFLRVPSLPSQFSIIINGKQQHYTIRDVHLTNKQWQQHSHWKWYHEPPTDRCSVFLSVWESLRPLPLPIIQEQLAMLRNWAGTTAPPDFRIPMNSPQLQSLFSNPLFTAGLHTHTHIDLNAADKKVQLEEIVKGKEILQADYGLHNAYLAYPYGRYNELTLEAVEAANLAACFTTAAMPVDAASDKKLLGRHQVGNWSVAEMKNLLSV